MQSAEIISLISHSWRNLSIFGCPDRLWNDLNCVEWGIVKLYSPTILAYLLAVYTTTSHSGGHSLSTTMSLGLLDACVSVNRATGARNRSMRALLVLLQLTSTTCRNFRNPCITTTSRTAVNGIDIDQKDVGLLGHNRALGVNTSFGAIQFSND